MLPMNSAMMCCLEERRTRVEKNRLWLLNDSFRELGKARVYLSTGTVDLSHACQHGKSLGRPLSLHISYREAPRGKGLARPRRRREATCRILTNVCPAQAALVMPASQQNPSIKIFLKAGLAVHGWARNEWSPRIDERCQYLRDFQTTILQASLRCAYGAPLALWVVWLDEVTVATITCPPTFSATSVEGFRCHGVLAEARFC